jgi:hypothetical protein
MVTSVCDGDLAQMMGVRTRNASVLSKEPMSGLINSTFFVSYFIHFYPYLHFFPFFLLSSEVSVLFSNSG